MDLWSVIRSRLNRFLFIFLPISLVVLSMNALGKLSLKFYLAIIHLFRSLFESCSRSFLYESELESF
jgi:hypothetical protein